MNLSLFFIFLVSFPVLKASCFGFLKNKKEEPNAVAPLTVAQLTEILNKHEPASYVKLVNKEIQLPTKPIFIYQFQYPNIRPSKGIISSAELFQGFLDAHPNGQSYIFPNFPGLVSSDKDDITKNSTLYVLLPVDYELIQSFEPILLDKKIASGARGRIYSIKPKKKKSAFSSSKNLYGDKVAKLEITDSTRSWQEIEMLQKVQGIPNVVQILGFQQELVNESFQLNVMNRAKEDLYDFIHANKPNEVQGKKFLHQMLVALQQMHKLGVYHQDLKLGNILVFYDSTENPTYQIADFGNAVHKDNLPQRNGGTLMYLPPELITRNMKIVAEYLTPMEVDVFCLGIMLFQFLTVEDLFDEEAIMTFFSHTIKDKNFKAEYYKNAKAKIDNQSFTLNAKNILHKMLCPVEQRLLPEALLREPWMTEP